MRRASIMVLFLSLVTAFSVCAADINSDLITVAISGDTATVEELLAKGADVNANDAEGRIALLEAAREGHADTVQVLLAKGAEVNMKNECCGDTALLWAAGKGQTKIVKILLDAGADVNMKNNGGHTALMMATEHDHNEVIELLKRAGAK